MAPLIPSHPLLSPLSQSQLRTRHNDHQLIRRTHLAVGKPTAAAPLTLEAWAQGFMTGSLIIMAFITISNMRRGVLLHKLILLELFLGMFHGTFIFTNPPVYGWYLGVTAALLNISWSLHNVIAWMKSKPFLSKGWSRVYIWSVVAVQPYWVVEVYSNFAYFNGYNEWFKTTRPWEALFRDPWWLLTTILLYHRLLTHYRIPLPTVIAISPRFGVLLLSMLLSLTFILLDILSVTKVIDNDALPDGLNPFWKLAFVFKCLCDSIVLDDFKTALERLLRYRLRKEGCGESYGEGGMAETGAGGGMSSVAYTETSGKRSTNNAGLRQAKTRDKEDELTYDSSSSFDDDSSPRSIQTYSTTNPAAEAEARRKRRKKHRSDIEWIEKELAMHSSSAGSSPVDDFSSTGVNGRKTEKPAAGEKDGDEQKGDGKDKKAPRVVTRPVAHWDDLPNLSLSMLRSMSHASPATRVAPSAISAPTTTTSTASPLARRHDDDDVSPTDVSPMTRTRQTRSSEREGEEDEVAGLREYDRGEEDHRHPSEPSLGSAFAAVRRVERERERDRDLSPSEESGRKVEDGREERLPP